MQSQCPCQSKTLGVTALADQIINVIAMTDVHRGLLNDRTIIKILGDVMGCGPDQLHSAIPGTLIRLGSFEGGKE